MLMRKHCRKIQGGGWRLFRSFMALFLALWLATGSYAQTSGSQQDSDLKNRKISLRASGESLGQILTIISKRAGVSFVYRTGLRGIDEPTTVNFSNAPLEKVLTQLLAKQDVKLTYTSNAVIFERDRKESTTTAKSAANTPAQALMRVSGTVVAERDKEPLVGAAVVVLDNRGLASHMGTMTDMDGKFTIDVPHKASIQVSYVGFEKYSMQITNHMANLEVPLKSGTDIDEVVVTGMGYRNKNSFTGGYVSVKGEELRKLSPTNMLKGLQFFDPSFVVVENNRTGSDPNAPMDIQIRGDQVLGGNREASTMELLLDNPSSRPNMPLFVLDGFIVSINRVLELDPERVESITILKDAAATSIYGSRAANGVVVVETKVAPDGKLQISYSGRLTLQTPDLSVYNLCNAAEKLELERLAGIYDENVPAQMNQYNRYLRNVLAGVDSYWLSQPVRIAAQHNHSLSAAGGTEVFRYTLSVNAGFTPGVMKGSSNKNKNVMFQMSYRKNKWIVGANITLADTRGDNSPYGSFSQYTQVNPYYPIYNAMGGYDRVLDDKGLGSAGQVRPIGNPLYDTTFEQTDFFKNLNMNNALNIEFAALDNLRFNAQMNYVRGLAAVEKFLPPEHTSFVNQTDLTQKGSYAKQTGETMNWSVDLSASYNLNKNSHLLSIMGNWSVHESKNNSVNLNATGYPNENMNDFIFGYEMNNRPNGTESTSRSMGMTAQLSYSYDNRYSADFNLRGDISSQFGADKRLAPFWSAGVRWNAHREKWLEGRISNLILRATYGITGSQSYSPYQAIEFYTFQNMMKPYLGSNVLGATLQGLNNDGLGWSKSENFNAAIEVGVWKNRVNMTLNYYNTITRQLLVDFNLAPSTGFQTQTMNAGELQNRGFEASMNVIAIQDIRNEIYWTLGANASHNVNRVRKVSNGLKAMNEQALKSNVYTNTQIYQEGHSTSTLYMVRSLGIDPSTGEEVYLTRDGQRTFTWNAADKVAVGDTLPKMRGSLFTTLNWKDLSFNLFFSYTLGASIYNQTLVDKVENRSLYYNTDRRALTDRWKTAGDVSEFKKLSASGNSTPASTRFLMTENTLSLGSLTIGYRMRNDRIPFLRKLNINVVNINFTTNELFRLSNIKQERGLDYPFARSYSLSLSFLFK